MEIKERRRDVVRFFLRTSKKQKTNHFSFRFWPIEMNTFNSFFTFFSLCVAQIWASNITVGNGAMPCTYSCSSALVSSYSFGKNGLNLLTAFEGFSSTCYKDSVGVWTIGYGHACQSSSTNLPQYGVTCTASTCSGTLSEPQAEEVLNSDVATFVSCVKNSVKVSITQNQFDALVSFAFNIGCSGFQTSTLLSELNAGKLTDAEAQYQFTRWHSGCLAGLERRRFAESQLFSSCATSFGCTHTNCDISYNYPKCASGCQYCSACGGCSGSTYSMPTCTNGGGAVCDHASCQNCVKYGGGFACATGACAGCSTDCLNCINGGGGTGCTDRCA